MSLDLKVFLLLRIKPWCLDKSAFIANYSFSNKNVSEHWHGSELPVLRKIIRISHFFHYVKRFKRICCVFIKCWNYVFSWMLKTLILTYTLHMYVKYLKKRTGHGTFQVEFVPNCRVCVNSVCVWGVKYFSRSKKYFPYSYFIGNSPSINIANHFDFKLDTIWTYSKWIDEYFVQFIIT